MCMSVPQIAVLAISIMTSLGPTFGSGMSSSQIPGAACCLTSAFMVVVLPDRVSLRRRVHGRPCGTRPGRASVVPGWARRGSGGGCGRGRGHSRAEPPPPAGDAREAEADDVDAFLEQPLGHAPGERGIESITGMMG